MTELIVATFLYYLPAFLVCISAILIADPFEDADVKPLLILFLIAAIPLVNIIAAYSLTRVVFPNIMKGKM